VSKTVTIKGFVYQVDLGLGEDYIDYLFLPTAASGDEHYALVGPAEFQFLVPDDFDAVAQRRAALEKRVAHVSEQIRKLGEPA
jgi:hypothetical protein